MALEETLKLAEERVFKLLKDQEDWKVSSKSNEHWKIESKLSDKLNCSVYRVVHCVKAPINVVKDTLNFLPSGRRREWDTDFKELILLKQVNDSTIVYVTRTNPIAKGVISPREFLNIAKLEDTEDSLTLIGCSVDYPDFEVDGSYVRGETACLLLKVEMDPKDPGLVRVTTLSEVDIKGRIPRYMVDSTVPGVLASSFETWRKFLEKEGHLQSEV